MNKFYTLLLVGALLLPTANSFAQWPGGTCLGNACDAGIIAINILPLNAGWTTPPYKPDELPEGEKVILGFNLKNYGDSVYYKPNVDYIKFQVTIGDDCQDMMVMFNSMNDGYDYLFPDELLFTTPNFEIQLPNYKTLDICIKVLVPNDVVASNDEMCKTFQTVGGVGAAPSSSGCDGSTNIRSNQKTAIHSVYFKDGYLSINLSNNENANELYTTITDITGRTIDYREANIGGSKNVTEIIPLSNLSKGIYIVSMRSDDGLIENKKFTVY